MKHTRLVAAVLFLLLGLVGSSSAQDQSLQYYQAGNTFYAQRNYDQAIRYYQYAGQLNPNLWQAYQGLGNCYYAKGDKATALTNYQKALAINPNNPQLSSFVQSLQAQEPQLPAPNGSAPSGNSPTSNTALSTSPSGEGLNPNLPKQGKIVFELEDSDWIGSWTDLNTYFGQTVPSTETPYGVKLGLGASYVLSPNFQLGAKVQFLLKTPELVTIGSVETGQWNESTVGGAIEGEGVFPINDGINFIGGLQVGFYTLVGTTIVASGTYSGTANIAGSAPGGMISAGVELLMDSHKSWALDLGLAYQFLSFSPLTDTPTVSGTTGTSYTLKNADGSNASFDFSGIGLSVGARFF